MNTETYKENEPHEADGPVPHREGKENDNEDEDPDAVNLMQRPPADDNPAVQRFLRSLTRRYVSKS